MLGRLRILAQIMLQFCMLEIYYHLKQQLVGLCIICTTRSGHNLFNCVKCFIVYFFNLFSSSRAVVMLVQSFVVLSRF